MAREIIARATLIVKDLAKGLNEPYNCNAQFDVDDLRGPTPGLILATVYGTLVDLSLLGSTGWCLIHNQDQNNHIDVGIWDPELLRFYPICEYPPTFKWPIPLSRFLQQEFGSGATTGTGTLGGEESNRLMIRGRNQSCYVFVGAFEGPVELTV